ncbi:transmembrane protein 177 [Apis laboriosa]|uniref:transmembrane protein 177 n=1 Tax=Apis laboriosa TaxID=183418 RepID=UPI001CC5998A|nr:transmembrane protein 177 [Apis laboriosa]
MKIFLEVAIASAVVSIQTLPQIWFLDYYRKFRSRYDFNNNEIPVRKDIQQKFQEVINDLHIPKSISEKIKLFNVYDINIFHAGTTYTKYGAIIGIPVNFEYDDIKNMTEQTITFRNIQVNWNPEINKEFQKSLILSKDAQKFLMARKILTITENYLLYEILDLSLNTIIGIIIYELLYLVLKVTKKQRGKNIFCMSIATFTSSFLWLLTSNAQDYYKELQLNEKMATLNDKYIKGGIEYYEKLSKRNKALRVLLGEKGTYLFTSDGNENTFFEKSIPVSDQIDYFKAKIQNIQLT